jgi:hypothetical protein
MSSNILRAAYAWKDRLGIDEPILIDHNPDLNEIEIDDTGPVAQLTLPMCVNEIVLIESLLLYRYPDTKRSVLWGEACDLWRASEAEVDA